METGKIFFDVITIGDCKADHFLDLSGVKVKAAKSARAACLLLTLGGKIPVPAFKFSAGGNALNAAVTFARMRLKTAVVAALGRDPEAERILDCMEREGIARDFITRDKTAPTPQTVILVVRGERVILGYAWAADYLLPEKFSASWVYLTSLGDRFKTVYRKVSFLKARDKFRLAYNPGTRQLLSYLPEVKRMIKFSDLLFVNAQEAQTILATKSGDPRFLLNGLLAAGASMAVVTNGSQGAVCSNGADYLKIAAFPGRRVDATGAGDAFASGFLAGLMENGMAEGLRWGGINATGEIGQIGVHTGLRTLTQMEKLLRAHGRYKACDL